MESVGERRRRRRRRRPPNGTMPPSGVVRLVASVSTVISIAAETGQPVERSSAAAHGVVRHRPPSPMAQSLSVGRRCRPFAPWHRRASKRPGGRPHMPRTDPPQIGASAGMPACRRRRRSRPACHHRVAAATARGEPERKHGGAADRHQIFVCKHHFEALHKY